MVEELDKLTDAVVELLGDPTQAEGWPRRGLLLGEVQSGKTQTYLGVLNKAIDYGYRLIVVIGGHTNELRRQTQIRVDSDLIGKDTSRAALHGAQVAPRIGIARFDGSIDTVAETTVDTDFSSNKRLRLNVINESVPTVLVIKKNARVIENVASYMRQQANGGKLDVPMVVIDDEADWGSPNTGSDLDPTRVNAAIRKLLDISRRSSYLGITATPFANVFISHEATHAELGEDLFPSDYIRVASAPSNYRGLEHHANGYETSVVCEVQDCLDVLPIRHKSSHEVTELPTSLEDAVITFIIGTAVRRARTWPDEEPCSMLVNVSRFTNIQRQVDELLREFAQTMEAVVVSEFSRGLGNQLSDEGRRIFGMWDRHFADSVDDVSFTEMCAQLPGVATTVRVELVNAQTTGSRARRRRELTQEQREHEDRLPTIFVGGDVLSRGLTLPGLQVSYFVREPRTVDTLMQMGRWFGYRDGYADLVRLWIPESTHSAIVWSAEIAQEFRDLVTEMQVKELTPLDFGLRVRSHPGGLAIVAANKRQNAEYISGDLLIHGNKFESYFLPSDPQVRRKNRVAATRLLERAMATVASEVTEAKYLAWRGVPRGLIDEFFELFRSDARDPHFGPKPGGVVPQIAQYLHEAKNADTWDLILVVGSRDPASELAPGLKIKSSIRNAISEEGSTLSVGNRRVATAHNLLGALSPTDAELIRERHRASSQSARSLTERYILENVNRPMFLLYALTTGTDQASGREPEVLIPPDDPLIAVVLGFPGLEVSEAAERIRSHRVQKFWVNSVWLHHAYGQPDDSDDVEDIEG